MLNHDIQHTVTIIYKPHYYRASNGWRVEVCTDEQVRHAHGERSMLSHSLTDW